MKRLPASILLMVFLLLVVSGYVSSNPVPQAQVIHAASTERHLDPHVSYYQEHLIKMGIEKLNP